MEQSEISKLEQEQIRGYESQPQTPEEVDEWEAEQFWDELEPEQHLEP